MWQIKMELKMKVGCTWFLKKITYTTKSSYIYLKVSKAIFWDIHIAKIEPRSENILHVPLVMNNIKNVIK